MPLRKVYDQRFTEPGSELKWQAYRSSSADGRTMDIIVPERVTNDGPPYLKVVFTAANPPFWDPNHHGSKVPGDPFGLGYVNLFHLGYCQPASPDGEFPPFTIQDALIVLRLRLVRFSLIESARLLWWMQFSGSVDGVPKAFNYGQVRNTIDQQMGLNSRGWVQRPTIRYALNTGWRDVYIPLPARDHAWLCYGASPARADDYGCAAGGIAEAMAGPLLDMGIHAVHTNQVVPSSPPSEVITGEMHLQMAQIWHQAA